MQVIGENTKATLDLFKQKMLVVQKNKKLQKGKKAMKDPLTNNVKITIEQDSFDEESNSEEELPNLELEEE